MERQMKSHMGVTREMITKIRSGDSISDEELVLMIKFLRKLELMLEVMTEDYGLALRDVRMTIPRLESFKDARERHRRDEAIARTIEWREKCKAIKSEGAGQPKT